MTPCRDKPVAYELGVGKSYLVVRDVIDKKILKMNFLK